MRPVPRRVFRSRAATAADVRALSGWAVLRCLMRGESVCVEAGQRRTQDGDEHGLRERHSAVNSHDCCGFVSLGRGRHKQSTAFQSVWRRRSLTLLDPRGIPFSAGFRLKESIMIWETPSFEEIEMNAEIGSYQEDFDGDESPQF